MLKTLLIRNLVLVEESFIEFKEGLTVITGETGSGKTALVEGLRLVLGERIDSSKIRKGCEKAFIQATFQTDALPLSDLFQEMGLKEFSDADLILSREISANGKSRALLNGQPLPASFLQTLSGYLIDFIGQHAHVDLRNPENQLEILDEFAGTDLRPFRLFWEEEKKILSEKEELILKKESGEKKRLILEEQLQEIKEANPGEGEEEKLFEEYGFLTNSQDILEKSYQIEEAAVRSLENCNLSCSILSSVRKSHPLLEEAYKMAKDAEIQLGEVGRTIQSFQTKIENDPNRISFLEERLKILNKLKKKFGANLVQVQKEIEQELHSLENLENQLDEIEKKLLFAKNRTQKEAAQIREKRIKNGQILEKILTSELQELNIPTAEVKILLKETNRSRNGEESATFLLRANKGEELVEIKEGTSGGELSRLLFSIAIALAEKRRPCTLVFDEIDSNVGGETATIMGQKLQKLGKNRQILCITHFPQVATSGDNHLRVSKEEINGRTLTTIQVLTQKQKKGELLRMLGGETAALKK